MRIAALAFLLSGCSLLVGGEGGTTQGADADVADAARYEDGALIPTDAAVADASPDAAVDAAPAECNRFLDTGCDDGEVCKNGDTCVIDQGDDPACTACATSGQCASGLGCNNACLPYCDALHPCGDGTECFNGYCVFWEECYQ